MREYVHILHPFVRRQVYVLTFKLHHLEYEQIFNTLLNSRLATPLKFVLVRGTPSYISYYICSGSVYSTPPTDTYYGSVRLTPSNRYELETHSCSFDPPLMDTNWKLTLVRHMLGNDKPDSRCSLGTFAYPHQIKTWRLGTNSWGRRLTIPM